MAGAATDVQLCGVLLHWEPQVPQEGYRTTDMFLCPFYLIASAAGGAFHASLNHTVTVFNNNSHFETTVFGLLE